MSSSHSPLLLSLVLLRGGLAQTRVDDLVDGEVDEGQARADDGDHQARRQEPPPGASVQRRAVLRIEQHRAQRVRGGRAQADEGQRRLAQDRHDDGEHELRADDRQQVRQDLDGDHAPRAFAGDLRGEHVVAAAHRQRLRPEHAGRAGPRGDRDDDDQHHGALARHQRGNHDGQRQTGDHQHDVGDQGEQIVPDAPDVGAEHAEDERHRGGYDADREADGQRAADRVAELGEHVLAGLRGAEPMLGGRRGQTDVVDLVGVLSEDWDYDGEKHHQADDGQADDQLRGPLGQHPLD